ncbi:death-associated inhibitor of apoptosis 1 [Octopus bimaculoides]|nr:death-associated inhibitor of apoptosis 1 [Octopus bimaculoides]|eukprot:XP_014785813.1 PREDICTED: death-associated inhibitor of apoptosis 1-like [Octopus bimaculoides]
MRSHTQRHRSGLRAPRPHFPPDIEPFSDDEPDNEAEDISFNNIDDNGNSGSVDLSSYRNASHRSCPVCKHYEFNAVVLPCGHTALCLKCALKYYYHQRKCPVCQKAISTVHRIYL